MIDPGKLTEILKYRGIYKFFGVPDSLLKALSAVLEQDNEIHHAITPNEGIAISRAIGSFLATQKIPAVYMQNSGMGNAINPILSLADSKVYGIPMLIIVGWRGELLDDIQIKDEPQHVKQGEVTIPLIESMKYKYHMLEFNSDPVQVVNDCLHDIEMNHEPVFMVVRKGTFSSLPNLNQNIDSEYDLSRESVIEHLLMLLPSNVKYIATTGKAGRELYELRNIRSETHANDFLCVGGMGHASSIAAEIATELPEHIITCIDGDGSTLMHLASIQLCAKCNNLLHVIIDNGAHESVGGQPTTFRDLDSRRLGQCFGYQCSKVVISTDQLRQAIEQFKHKQVSTLLIVRCRQGSRINLGRPETPPVEQRSAFISSLNTYQGEKNEKDGTAFLQS
ncbi:phosphonopyruvate decarboxylase [Vibrio rhizosphaerae]|uniref:Phosphonopyruvate decarboxylase n=1 Tax=Vibrio rhizosphaerae TaxID=398736 RepID=A0ABU4IRV8_9VIBR|nr:phosphonopyruvate decarboxylase [Vibrio rhizosphaerae]MDW6092141.1 phosphonopyruvate decarboxylase [Vibrio rhizosphaerae]